MDITDALDSYLRAKVRVGEWENEFMGKFYRPVGEILLNMAMQGAKNSPMIDKNKLEQNLSPKARQKFRGE